MSERERFEVVYIAGPYRGKTAWERERNIKNAQELALEFWKRGFVAICPHANTARFDGECPDETWLAGDIEILSRCDSIALVRGWSSSSGAIEELRYAVNAGMNVWGGDGSRLQLYRRDDLPGYFRYVLNKNNDPQP